MYLFKNQLLFLSLFALVFTACENKSKKAELEKQDSLSMAKPWAINEVMGIAIIEPVERITNLAANSSGIIKEVYAQSGQLVKSGEILLKIDSDLDNVEVQQAQSKVLTQKQAIEAATANIQILKSQLNKANSDLSRDQALYDGKALTSKELENTKYTVINLQKQIDAQVASLDQQKAKLNEINTDIKYYRTSLDQKIVRSPSDGTLLSFDVKKGEYLSPNQTIAEFAPTGPLMALTEIDEIFATKVKVGQKANIKNQGSEEVIATGTVILTSPYLRKKSLFSENTDNLEDRRVREVRVELDDASNVLIGSRVECWIDVKK